MHLYKLTYSFSVLFCAVCSYSAATEAANSSSATSEFVEIQSYRLSPSLKHTPANVTVINRNDIETLAAQNVVELLTSYGFHVEQAAGSGSLSSIYLRGADPNFTLVLINGVKVNDPTNSRGGSFDFSSLSLDTIEQIEIVRGPLSSTYGSDALSGVINIITKQAQKELEASVNLVKGENGMQALSSTYEIQSDQFQFSITGAYNDSGEQVEGTELESSSADLKGTWIISNATQLNFHTRYYDSDSKAFPDDSGGSTFAVLPDVDERDVFETLANLELLHTLNKKVTLSLKSSVFHHEEDTDSPGVAPGIRDPLGIPINSSDSEFTRYALTASSIITPNKNISSAVGMDIEIEEGNTKGFLDFGFGQVPTNFDLDRTTYSAFSEIEAFIGPFTMLTGLRFDSPEDFSGRLSPNFGANYHLPNLTSNLRFNWGKGFKLPSFFALGNPIVGNENIKPETSEIFEVGFDTSLFKNKGQVNITFFTQEFNNIVDFDAGPPPSLVNRSKVHTKGMEFGLGLIPIKNVTSQLFVNYVDTNIKGDDGNLLNRPEWRGSVSVNWQAKHNLQFSFNTIYVDEVEDSSIPTGIVTLDDYIRANVSAAWQAIPNLNLIFAVDNLLDEEYEETIGNEEAGISARFQLRGKF